MNDEDSSFELLVNMLIQSKSIGMNESNCEVG